MLSAGKFCDKYGPWAVVAGASEGIGAAFATRLAERGVNLVLAARRSGPLVEMASTLTASNNVQCRIVPVDLGEPGGTTALFAEVKDLDVGFLVFNAALAPIGPFLGTPLETLGAVIDLNCRATMTLAYGFGGRMVQRGSGGIVIMASMAGLQGSALVAQYAASKAYCLTLAESLWDELKEKGVDVLAAVAGATNTPGYQNSKPSKSSSLAPRVLEPLEVADEALGVLGRQGSIVTGRGNRFADFFMHRILSRSSATRLMGQNTRRIYG